MVAGGEPSTASGRIIMVVVGCCVVPSWPGVLDLDLPDLPDSAQQLHVAAKYIGDHVADLKPDMIGDGGGDRGGGGVLR